MSKIYRQAFYRSMESLATRSARQIMPFILQRTGTTSVVDVGCGTGDWLRVCMELGVTDILGVDFHDGRVLNIPADQYLSHDLTKPLKLPRKFDLAMSLEVGEHLPPDTAKPFVALLTSLAPAVLFSAAIPLQGGTNHLNEQWPRYWAELFRAAGYTALDCIRPHFWENDQVTGFYAQNTVLYVRSDSLNEFDGFAALPSFDLRPVVHHGMYTDAATELSTLRPLYTSRGLLRRLPGALWESIASRSARLLSRDD